MSYVTTVLADAPLYYHRCADPGGFILTDIGSQRWRFLCNPNAQCIGYSGIAADGGAFLCANGVQFWSSDTKARVSPFTVECWVYIMSNRQGSTLDIFRWDSNANPFANLQFLGASQQFKWNAGNVSVTDPTHHNPQSGWYHLVAVYDHATVSRLYVNALSVGTGVPTGAINDAQTIQWGVSAGNLGSHVVTECAIYSGVLSPTQVNNHFLAQEVTAAPVFQLPGGSSGSNGGFGSTAGQLAQILSSVRKVY